MARDKKRAVEGVKVTEMARASCTWQEVGFYFGSTGKPKHET